MGPVLLVQKINGLINDTCRDPFKGLGKPEALRGSLAGDGSRRINDEHRMVYKAMGGDLLIAQLRYHH